MGEGLFRPGDTELPESVIRALGAVVRVYTRIRFRVFLYPTQQGVDAARNMPGAYDQQFEPDGSVVWPYRISVAELRQLRADPLARVQPGRFEMLHSTRSVELEGVHDVWQTWTPQLAGSATGFLIGEHAGRALVATNYHVAREAIGRLGRETGRFRGDPEPAVNLVVGVGNEHIRSHSVEVVEDVQLLANASHAEWRNGLDWAVLSIPGSTVANRSPLVLTPSIRPGDPLWAMGFPVRSCRAVTQGYPNADDTLRVSTGPCLGPEPDVTHGWRADLDGLAGNSGGPVVNRDGEVVGIFRNHTHYDFPSSGPVDRRFTDYGGEAQLTPAQPLIDLLATLA